MGRLESGREVWPGVKGQAAVNAQRGWWLRPWRCQPPPPHTHTLQNSRGDGAKGVRDILSAAPRNPKGAFQGEI